MTYEALTVIHTEGTLVLPAGRRIPKLTAETREPPARTVAQAVAWLTGQTLHLGLRAQPEGDPYNFHESGGQRAAHMPDLAWDINKDSGMISIDPLPNRAGLPNLHHEVTRSIGDVLHFAGVEGVHVHTEYNTDWRGPKDSPSRTSGISVIEFTRNPKNSSGPPYHIESDSDRLALAATQAALITLAEAGRDGVSRVLFERMTAGPQP